METSQVRSERIYPWTPHNLTMTGMKTGSGIMLDEVRSGLRAIPKKIAPKYFYDAEGSMLFDRICRAPEYYLTRTETAILEKHAGAMLERMGEDLCVIEPGAGACAKAQFLLDTGRVRTFVPVDISTECLRAAALRVAQTFPHVALHAVAMDFLAGLGRLEPLLPRAGRRLIFYPGSSIGNFDPPDAVRLLAQFHELLRDEDGLLIGYDLQKDSDILRSAYDDSRGVTAAFNLNLLARFNRDLGADFDLSAFRHVALYNEADGRIEMHLESLTAQEVFLGHEPFLFDPFERIHTENSYKYTVARFDAMAACAGFDAAGLWTDPASYFAVSLYTKRGLRLISDTIFNGRR